MLMMLLGNSGIKVISLVAIRKKGNCDPWTNHLLSREGIEEIESFIEWWGEKSLHHNITIRESDFESGLMHLIRKTKKLLVKPVSCLNPKKPKDVFSAQNLVDKMKGALRLLALEQINILSSEDEHVIIDSPYGSGKSIIVRVTGKILCDRLLENELSCCMLMVQVVLCHIKY